MFSLYISSTCILGEVLISHIKKACNTIFCSITGILLNQGMFCSASTWCNFSNVPYWFKAQWSSYTLCPFQLCSYVFAWIMVWSHWFISCRYVCVTFPACILIYWMSLSQFCGWQMSHTTWCATGEVQWLFQQKPLSLSLPLSPSSKSVLRCYKTGC